MTLARPGGLKQEKVMQNFIFLHKASCNEFWQDPAINSALPKPTDKKQSLYDFNSNVVFKWFFNGFDI